ncbi:lipoate--protein ligase family protein [Sulfobacillus sp. hq2]|uniref:lipoate--protein ligase family protein n=1 Tax=Sulfobacillus TaxID=28033 RepID=UPI000CD22D9B|nr:lipoate--protein ligase family protein [Sulfobacillus sp. hq2]POB11350.1 ligase [Sulfobacillus sp. hq2]
MLPLYMVGEVDWLTTQALYHALPTMHEEGIVLCWPRDPYVSIGCHQDWQEFDARAGLPVVRRHVGGTLVYLDQHQIFFQVIVNASHHVAKKSPQQWYQYALAPVVSYLQTMGFAAMFKSPADILINNRKISGNAGGQIEDSVVIVGNILLRFDPEMMVKVRAGSSIFKHSFADALARHLTTLEELSGREWQPETVMRDLATSFHRHWDTVLREVPWDRWNPVVAQVGRSLLQPRWLYAPGMRPRYHQIKVREGVYLRQPREDAWFPDIVAEVDTERQLCLQIWNLPFEVPLPLPYAQIGDYIGDPHLQEVLLSLMDRSTSSSLLP